MMHLENKRLSKVTQTQKVKKKNASYFSHIYPSW